MLLTAVASFCLLLYSQVAAQFTTAPPPIDGYLQCSGSGELVFEGDGRFSIVRDTGSVGSLICQGNVSSMTSSAQYTRIISDGTFACNSSSSVRLCGLGDAQLISSDGSSSMLQCNGVPLFPTMSNSSTMDYCNVSGEYSLGGDGTYSITTQSGNISCIGDVIPTGSYITTFGVFYCQGRDVVLLNGTGLIYTAMGDILNSCASLLDNTSFSVPTADLRTTCVADGANAFIGNGQFYITINNSAPNSGLVCDGIVNEVITFNDITFTQSFGPFRCISSGELSINGTGVVVESGSIICTVIPITNPREPLECSGTGEFEIIGSGLFEIFAIPEITCNGLGESFSFDMGQGFVSRGSFVCNGSDYFTLNGTGEIGSVTTVLGNHNCTEMPISGSGVIDVITCSGEGDYVVVGDGSFSINRSGPGILQCSGEVTSGINTSERADYFINGEFTCMVSGVVYFTGMGRAEVINASAPYQCNGVIFPGPTVEPPFSGFGGDEIDCFAYGEIVIIGSGLIQVVAQSPTPLQCQGEISSDLDQNEIVSSGDFMCTVNGFALLAGRGEVFVNSTGFNNCTRRDNMVSDTPLSCSGFGEHEIFGLANATIFASDMLVCNGDVFPLASPNGSIYYVGGNYRCICHGTFIINGVGNATILTKPNATSEGNYSCIGSQPLNCASFAFGGGVDGRVRVIGEGEFTIIGDEALSCTGAVLCPGEINYYFTDGSFYCSSDVFARITGTGTIDNITGANNCSGLGFGVPPIASGTPLAPRVSCIGYGDQYEINGNGTFNTSRLLGTLDCSVRLQEPTSDVYRYSSNEEAFSCNGSGIFAFGGTGDSTITLDDGYFNCMDLAPSTSVITTTPTVTASVSIAVSTTVLVSTPTTSVSTSVPTVLTPTTSVSTPTTSVSTPTTSVSTSLPTVSTPTTSVSTTTTSMSTPTTNVSTPTTSVSTPTTSVSTSVPITTTTSVVPTVTPVEITSKRLEDLTEIEENNTITLQFKEFNSVAEFNLEEFVEFILKIMKNERSRRQTETGEETVVIIDPSPILVDEVLEVAFFVLDEQGMVVNGTDVADAVLLNENDLLEAVGATSVVVIEGLSEDLIDFAENQNNSPSDDDDGGLSGGIVALIVILVLLAVSALVAIVIGYLVYKRKRQGRFNILQGFVRPRNYGTDYVSDNPAADNDYTSTQELHSSQVKEMVSSEPESITAKLIQDETKSEGVINPNFDTDIDKDTRL